MTEQEFLAAATQIADFLGVPAPAANRICAWMPKVKHIPGEAISYIVGRITDDADSMPRNLPKAFRSAFEIWQRLHPEKVAREGEQLGCSDCDNGILWLSRTADTGRIETCTVFCRCYTGNSGAVGRASLAEMQQRGWQSEKASTGVHPGIDTAAQRDCVANHLAGARRDEMSADYRRKDLYGDDYMQGETWA